MKKEEIDLESKGFLNDVNNNNVTDDIEVSVPSKKQAAEFVGLTKEQVLKYGTSPSWVRARWIIFVLFWLAVIGMIVLAVVFVYVTPKCAHVEKMPWYKKDVAYQIDVEHFKDTDGDGVGDLEGINSELDYLEKLGAKTLYLSNILDQDKKINPQYGGEVALAKLKKSLLDRSMHVMIDVSGGILDKALLEDLLKNKVDGVMITDVDQLVAGGDKKLDEVFNALQQAAKDIGKKTFKEKFLGVRTSSVEQAKPVKSASLVLIDEASPSNGDVDASKLNELIRNSAVNKDEWNIFSSGSVIARPTSGEDEKATTRRMLKNGVLLFLRGTPLMKYGDELNYDDKSGKLMKWNEMAPSCGFSTNNNTNNDCTSNVQDQSAHGSDLTTLKFFRKLAKIRSDQIWQSAQWGQMNQVNAGNKKIVAFSREAAGFDGFLVVANLGDSAVRFDYQASLGIPDDGEVLYYTEQSSELAVGSKVHTHNILVKPLSFLVVKFNRNPKQEESAPSASAGH